MSDARSLRARGRAGHGVVFMCLRQVGACGLWLMLLSLASVGCNLSFDPDDFPPQEQSIEDAGDGVEDEDAVEDEDDSGDPMELPPGCEDNDSDGVGRGQDCPKDENDCDDTRAFVFPGAEERCDGLDNDCDDLIDEDEDGQTLSRPCYTGESEQEHQHGGTACQPGRVLCDNGQFPEPVPPEACVGQILPSDFGEREGRAMCDSVDNDCDGEIDPECPCGEVGETDECYSVSEARFAGVGICSRGVRTCIETDDGRDFGNCEGDVAPGEETCANPGTDDDCDGEEDNVPGVGMVCQTGEHGVCAEGRMACVGEELTCVRITEPSDIEVCNDLDDNCNGETDEGVSNECGGCGALTGTLGAPCGVCNDGELTCTGPDSLTCVGASGLNACGGCAVLDEQPDAECGQCGRTICQGNDEVVCADPGLNICGGCGPVANGERFNQSCGTCGVFECEGTNAVVCVEGEANACGGCVPLNGEVGAECGPCEDGLLACADDDESLECVGARTLNVCGGCQNLGDAQINDSCGQCGALRCDPDNPGTLVCEDPGRNACGGCGVLPNTPNTPCGQCGTYTCEDGTTVCDDPGFNTCGGCLTLEGGPEGDECGECGQWSCTSAESIVCDDPGFNGCGGCAELIGEPNTSCGQCGLIKCTPNPDLAVCDDPGLNACGGCGEVVGQQLGTSCGQCGVVVCDGGNATRCDDPGLNTCGFCGTLANEPGSSCGECAVHVCDDDFDRVVCDDRICIGDQTAFRLFNMITNFANGFDVYLNDQPLTTGLVFPFRNTNYLATAPGEYNFKLYTLDADPLLETPLLTKTVTLAPGTEYSAFIQGDIEGVAGVDWDMTFFEDDNVPVEGKVKARWVHTFVDRGAVDVYFDGVQVFSNVAFMDVSGYVVVDGPVETVSVHVTGSPFSFATFSLSNPFLNGSIQQIIHRGRESDPDFPQIINADDPRDTDYFPL